MRPYVQADSRTEVVNRAYFRLQVNLAFVYRQVHGTFSYGPPHLPQFNLLPQLKRAILRGTMLIGLRIFRVLSSEKFGLHDFRQTTFIECIIKRMSEGMRGESLIKRGGTEFRHQVVEVAHESFKHRVTNSLHHPAHVAATA
ncbi:hypothetical protein FQZ97_1146680 [compost metagenome]